MSDAPDAESLARWPRDLLTDDERDRARAFGIPPLLLIAVRGEPAHGHFRAQLRDAGPVEFSHCTICPEHQWVTLIGLDPDSGSRSGILIAEVRVVDIVGVFASDVFDVRMTGDGARLSMADQAEQRPDIQISPPPREISIAQMLALVDQLSPGLKR